jgi:hypothetical protein
MPHIPFHLLIIHIIIWTTSIMKQTMMIIIYLQRAISPKKRVAKDVRIYLPRRDLCQGLPFKTGLTILKLISHQLTITVSMMWSYKKIERTSTKVVKRVRWPVSNKWRKRRSQIRKRIKNLCRSEVLWEVVKGSQKRIIRLEITRAGI